MPHSTSSNPIVATFGSYFRARVLRLELWGASRKSGLLSEVCGRPVEIVAPGGAVINPD